MKINDLKLYPVVYIFVLMFITSSIIIGIVKLTEKHVKMNEKIAIEKAVIQVFPEIYKENMINSEIHKLFKEKFKKISINNNYYYVTEDKSYAIPIEGKGFWAPIKGFIGIKQDKKTISAISFYEQNETPGLGAEITKDKFRKQFNEKKLSLDGKINFKRKGEKLSEHDIEAITGATQTSTRLEKIINSSISKWLNNISSQDNE